ncbi:MAG TPA: hypothetical protein VGZ90_08780 [Puia sp.]|jgi:hypothetical protein|nr:hypothetical protein [Puia sp.]
MKKITIFHLVTALAFSLVAIVAKAQTVDDAIMMSKKQWCNGLTYMHSSWNEYWEGTTKRDNKNLGTVTTQSVIYMSSYGITDRLNVLVNVPYVWTNASAGTLHGMKGFQDIDLDLKYEIYKTKIGKGELSLIGLMGFSTPLSNYENDFLPMSIGLGSTNLSGRLTADYQNGLFFTTLSSAYVYRSNVTIDRTSYYTDQIHYTNEVDMPNQLNSNLFVGIRNSNLTVQAQLINMYTFGGFDIRKNDMPFVSNQMNMTSLGAHVKYFLPFIPNLEVVASADFVIAGRNVGQAQTYMGGFFYILSL